LVEHDQTTASGNPCRVIKLRKTAPLAGHTRALVIGIDAPSEHTPHVDGIEGTSRTRVPEGRRVDDRPGGEIEGVIGDVEDGNGVAGSPESDDLDREGVRVRALD
jgi:hypothetical protein